MSTTPDDESSSAWTFEARWELSGRVSQLPRRCLGDVVQLIFGQSKDIAVGDEFVVDFEKLSDTVCADLDHYVRKKRPTSPVPAPPARRRKRRTDEPSTAVRRGGAPRGPPRVVTVEGSTASVLAETKADVLLLYDDDLALQWVKRDATTPSSPANDDEAAASADDCERMLDWLERLDVAPAVSEATALVRARLRGGQYGDAAAFADDVRRSPNEPSRAARVFLALFEGEWRRRERQSAVSQESFRPSARERDFGDLVGKRVDVCSGGQWLPARVVRLRSRDNRLRVEYVDSKHVEYVDPRTTTLRASSSLRPSKSVQRLARLVWAPKDDVLWPAELCLPDDLPKKRAGRFHVVLYVGTGDVEADDDGSDVVDAASVKPLDAATPATDDPAHVHDAYTLALARKAELSCPEVPSAS